MSADDLPPDEVLDCGCFLRCSLEPAGPSFGGPAPTVRTITVSPCRPGCSNLANALALAGDRGVSVTRRVAP